MTDATDHELIYRAQAGDRLAFSRLIERHYGMMFKVAWQFCGVREDAEDIAQESAIKIAGHLDAFKFESAFTTWIYRVVINAAKDYYKAKNRRNTRELPIYEDVQYVAHDPTPEQKLQYKDLLQALAALPETLKETVVLVCWQGLSHKEAAVALECSEGTVSWRIHEARKKLAEFGGDKMKAHVSKVFLLVGTGVALQSTDAHAMIAPLPVYEVFAFWAFVIIVPIAAIGYFIMRQRKGKKGGGDGGE